MKSCYYTAFFRYSPVVLLTIFFWLFPVVSTHASDLDSLRVLIRSLQDKISQNQVTLARLSEAFNNVNAKIYEYKDEDNGGVNPFSRFRIQNALKTSHQLADSLEILGKRMRQERARLQKLYAQIIQALDREIQHEVSLVRQNPPGRNEQKKRLDYIQKLENEKSNYLARSQTMKVAEQDWEKIVIEPGDSLRRLKLKTALLEDFLNNINQSSNSLTKAADKNRAHRKTYADLADFYRELDESVDDDRDIFDRNRIQELRDKIENLDREFVDIKQRTGNLIQDIAILKARIDRFKTVISTKEAE